MKAYKYLLVAVFLTVAVYYLFAPSFLERFLIVNVPVSSPDAIVLMAGSKDLRVPAVADLYHQGVAPRILLANDGIRGAFSTKYQRNLYMVEWAREDLLELDVPEDVIELLGFSVSGSMYDALNARDFILKQGNVASVLVVTSDYHTRRTLWCFRQVFSGTGVEVGVSPISTQETKQYQAVFRNMEELLKYGYYLIRYHFVGMNGVK